MNNKKILKKIKFLTPGIIEETLDCQYQNDSKIWAGKLHEEWRVETKKHLAYLIEAFESLDNSIFINYILWVKEFYKNQGLSVNTIKIILECIQKTIKYKLGSDSIEICEYIEAGSESLVESTKIQKSFIDTNSPIGKLAKDCLDALLIGEHKLAKQLIFDSIGKGTRLKEIYLDVLQSIQYEIGRLWHKGEVSIAQEHYCSATIEQIISQLYTKILSIKKKNTVYVGTCIDGELHQIGARMVAAFFEMDGWTTYYLGAKTPTNIILSTLEESNADILGISVSMSTNHNKLKDLIETIKSSKNVLKKCKIMVGGYYILNNSDLWQKVGADATAKSAAEAVLNANKLMEKEKCRWKNQIL